MQSKRFDERFVLEAELPTVDYTDKVDEIQLATLARVPTGISVWLRPIPVQQLHPGLRGMGSRRIRLNVMVAVPEAAGTAERVLAAMHMDDDAELPF